MLDVIDEQNTVIGQETKLRVHEQGLRHRVSAVLLQNEQGDYLIPTASDKKVEAGGLFHSAAGHVTSRQSYSEGAKRELWEETGVQTNFEPQLLGSFWLEKDYPTRKEKERFEVFKVTYDPAMGPIVLNEEQINEQWLSEAILKQMYLESPEKLSYPLQLSCKLIFKFVK